jgi:hypothetical protein
MGRAVVLRIEPPLASRPYGRPSLTPPAWSGLRAPLARSRAGRAVLLFPSPYHGVLAVKGCAPLALAAVAVFDPVTACAAPCWGRFQAIPPEQPEHDHVATFSVSRFFAAGA